MTEYSEKYFSKDKVKTVILILTHKCNLNCVYCYEHNKNDQSINIGLAKDILEKEMLLEDGLNREIEFFGGEPFVEFDKIVALYDFLKSRNWDKKWIVTITTNGTLVHGDIMKWLDQHQENVKVALSVDGTPEMHNINRSGSFDQIDLDFFATRNSIVKMTVSVNTLPFLAEGIIYLHERGFKVVRSNLAFGIDWPDENNLSVFSRELRKLADYYIDNPRLRPSDILDLPIENINPYSLNYGSRHCGAGVELLAYDIDGIAYPCHTFAPVSTSKEIAKESLSLSFDKVVSQELLDDKCNQCIVANVCPNCYGINFSTTGNMYSKDDGYCQMIKVQFIANAYFKYRQLNCGLLTLSPKDEYRLLNNINLIQQLEIK